MATAIPTETLSTVIVKDLFISGLRTAAADGGKPLTDPNGGSRPAKSEFITGAFPQRQITYPLILVEESDGGNSTRPDRRVGLSRRSYPIEITVHARSRTEMWALRDQVRHWLEENIQVMIDAGFEDPETDGGRSLDWEARPEIYRWGITVTGTVHTEAFL